MPPKKKRVAGFSHQEIDSLLDVIEGILSLGLDEWEAVERQHNSMYPNFGMTYDALRQKVAKLYLKKIPTEHPHCPPESEKSQDNL
jgi:hypothetical protein